ncbi:MAG: peptide chain release factor 2 [Proteobacteria bacterium]|nr:peptide chain release factor 2 [Pseudomonadota bacterium]
MSVAYLFNTPKQQHTMLQTIGVESIDELFDQVPQDLRLKRLLDLPQPLTELELEAEIRRLAAQNVKPGTRVSFLGGGVYDHYIPAVVDEVVTALRKMSRRAARLRLEALLSGEADGNDCYLEVHAGAGGTESQDWAEMLIRMYLRWAERHEYKVEWIAESLGEEAGIKSATVRISGANAYGWCKTESGVHRLVRISPYDSSSRRHTSFASVWVYPVIDEEIEIEINENDLRVDTYRASGAGGQHVNTTDSAVRITHLPTKIVVQCQNQRSQHKNRASAMKMLKARLYEAELQKREEKAQAQAEAKTEIGWGHQIRSYVLQPYQMVKDLRTGVESGNPNAVLDGDLDKFMQAALAARVTGEGADIEDLE